MVAIRGSRSISSSHGSLFRGNTDYLRPSYFTADASAGMSLDRWEFTVFVKNLTNNHTVIQQPSIQSLTEAYYLRPRTIGVTASGTRGTGSLSLLSAKSLSATGGTTLAGRSLSSRTGQLTGTPSLTLVTPNAKGVYAVRVPAHAAAILTLSA